MLVAMLLVVLGKYRLFISRDAAATGVIGDSYPL